MRLRGRASSVACASEFKPLNRPESARQRESHEREVKVSECQCVRVRSYGREKQKVGRPNFSRRNAEDSWAAQQFFRVRARFPPKLVRTPPPIGEHGWRGHVSDV